MEVLCFVSVANTVISDVSATPQDDGSLLLQWISPDSSSLKGFVVEWRPLLKADLSLTHFELADRSQRSFVITGMFYSVCTVYIL